MDSMDTMHGQQMIRYWRHGAWVVLVPGKHAACEASPPLTG